MRNVRRILQWGAGLLLALTLAKAETPPADALSGLLQNSPFGAPAPAGGPPEAAKALEFRGVFVDQGETFFSLYEGSSRSSRWVALKESGNPFIVQAYDPAKGEVRVDYQGRSLQLELKQAKVTASPILAATPPPAPAAAPGQAPVIVAGSTDEAVRLAQIAEEIRRRRALRQQAMQSQPPPPAPPK